MALRWRVAVLWLCRAEFLAVFAPCGRLQPWRALSRRPRVSDRGSRRRPAQAMSADAMGHACHCFMMVTMTGMMVFLGTIPKLRAEIGDELHGHHVTAAFFLILLTATAILT